MTQFQIGQTYSTRSLCDYDCIFSFTVIARTAKFLTLSDRHGQVRRVGIFNWEGGESCHPLGRYSMAPTISADRLSD